MDTLLAECVLYSSGSGNQYDKALILTLLLSLLSAHLFVAVVVLYFYIFFFIVMGQSVYFMLCQWESLMNNLCFSFFFRAKPFVSGCKKLLNVIIT